MRIGLTGEAVAKLADGRELALVMNNAAWIAAEDELDQSYLEILQYLVRSEIAKRVLKLGVQSALLFAATRAQHREMSRDDCAALIIEDGNSVGDALAKAIAGSIKMKDDEPGEARPAKTPAKPKRSDGIGKKS